MHYSLESFRLYLLSNGYAIRTVTTCVSHLKYFLAQNEYTHENVVRYIADMKERGLSNKTINRQLAFLKSYAKYVGDLPTQNLKFFKVEQGFVKKILSDDEIERFLAVPPNKFQGIKTYARHQVFWLLCCYTACRPLEVANLKPSNFDFDKWEISITETKTYQTRTVPIAKAIQGRIFEYVTSLPPNNYVCPLTPSAWKSAFIRRLEKAGIKKVKGLSAYSLRHTAGTAIAKTSGILQAKNILGHKNLSTTEQYIHLDTQALHDAINSISYAKVKLTPEEKIDLFLREVVKTFFWDEKEFNLEVKKTGNGLSLKIDPR